ncbi:UNVERIFIED_CONTAM: hypothetical protein Sangu_1816300 [Sesamum angustifolium]|uniref:Uncharacterized protein n=1 Tax=Sesamum angustifolium TaxID=2727405 RepID=A0AAW2MAB7_9LAMI
MESDTKLELIQKAIRKLMEEVEIKANIEASLSKESLVGVDDNEKSSGQQQLLSKLLSELESLEEEKIVTEESKAEANVEDKLCWAIDESNGVGGREEIMKELKEASEMQKQVTEPTYLPGLKIPDLPHLELPGFNTSGDEEEEE